MSNVCSDGWVYGVRHVPSPYFNDRPVVNIDMLVIHNISLPCGQFGTPYVLDLFAGCLDCSVDDSFADLENLQVSSHFFISRVGEITQFVPLDKRAWHAGVSCYQGRENINDCSIGIELEGTDDLPYTDEQYSALVSLTNQLMCEYPINSSNIVGHSDIAPERKTDPGKAFDWYRYLSAIEVK